MSQKENWLLSATEALKVAEDEIECPANCIEELTNVAEYLILYFMEEYRKPVIKEAELKALTEHLKNLHDRLACDINFLQHLSEHPDEATPAHCKSIIHNFRAEIYAQDHDRIWLMWASEALGYSHLHIEENELSVAKRSLLSALKDLGHYYSKHKIGSEENITYTPELKRILDKLSTNVLLTKEESLTIYKELCDELERFKEGED